MGGWSTAVREQARDPKDDGKIVLFNLADSLLMCELSLKQFNSICRRAKVKAVEGTGKKRTYSFREINAIWQWRREKDKSYKPPEKVYSCGPVYRGC